ncbi:hypothetical protein [Luteolibacter luteus]|uniref:Uncharacterized protein n=1 Tax=Luteolibacter luteus TaxID=2728835 RepID=A0A858RFV2_9BACT|nr:hypothetical protein [Luteolibacter luteus]QJE95170.1 hypothetical protein HHL09_05070 [Luteolibacter luteus]
MSAKIRGLVTWLRRYWGLIVLLVLLLRFFPFVGIATEWNLRGAIVHKLPEASFLPPPVAPVEVRSGRAHPGFDAPRLIAELLFLPTAIRQGHAFKRNDPALSPGAAVALATLLSDPGTYSEWLGESACGGFHADWYLRWDDGHAVIICEGCQEILLYYQNRFIRCDLSRETYKEKKIEAIVRPESQG